jgi:hypothetical protein
LVEQRTFNPFVVGSTPAGPTKFKKHFVLRYKVLFFARSFLTLPWLLPWLTMRMFSTPLLSVNFAILVLRLNASRSQKNAGRAGSGMRG